MKITIDRPLTMCEQGARDHQEDAMWRAAGEMTADDRVFVVCDGMGGHEHGDVASKIASEAVGTHLTAVLDAMGTITDDDVRAAVARACEAVTDAESEPAVRHMGTTLTLLVFHRGGVTAAHVGDSRIYHLRPATGKALYWSRDHSVVMEQWQLGNIKREQMATAPRRNVITRAIIAGGEPVEPDIVHITDVQPGDRFVLCTDGVTESLEHEQLLDLLSRGYSDDELLARLVNDTADNKDNHTACIVRVAAVEHEEGDDTLTGDEDSVFFNVMRVLARRTAEDAADDAGEDADAENIVVVQPDANNVDDDDIDSDRLLRIVVAVSLTILLVLILIFLFK